MKCCPNVKLVGFIPWGQMACRRGGVDQGLQIAHPPLSSHSGWSPSHGDGNTGELGLAHPLGLLLHLSSPSYGLWGA